MFTRAKDLICALLLLLAAGGYYVASLGINRSALADEVGATGLPTAYAIALAALAVALAVKALLSRRFAGGTGIDSGADGDLRGEGRKLVRAVGMLAIGIGYVIVVDFVGYALTLVAVIALVAIYQGERMDRRLAFIAIGGAALFFVFFSLVLGIDMPAGLWSQLALF